MKRMATLLLIGTSVLCHAYIAPGFKGETLEGTRISLDEKLSAKRALMLCFWASWCVPCLEELTQLRKGLAENTGLALDVLTVNVDTAETSNDVRPTMKTYGLKFPVVMDPAHKIFSRYQKQGTLPFSVLINSKGEVVETFHGLHDGMFEQLKKRVIDLVGDPDAKTASVAK